MDFTIFLGHFCELSMSPLILMLSLSIFYSEGHNLCINKQALLLNIQLVNEIIKKHQSYERPLWLQEHECTPAI